MELPVLGDGDSYSPWVYLGPDYAPVSALAVSPQNPEALLASIDGLDEIPVAYTAYLSVNDGEEWTHTPFRAPTLHVAYTPQGNLLALGVRRVEYSEDGGQTWSSHSMDPIGSFMYHYSQVDFRDDGQGDLWIRTGRFPESEVLRVAQDFSEWNDVTPPMPEGFYIHRIAVSHQELGTVAVAATSNSGQQTRVWITTDDGATWTMGGSGLPLGNVSDLKWQNGRLLLAMGPRCCSSHSGLFASNDVGLTFQALWAGSSHAPVNTVTFDPDDDRRLWIATEYEGIHYSDDAGLTWAAGIGGTFGLQIRLVHFDPATSRLWAALGNDGLFVSEDGGGSFERRSVGLNALPVTDIASVAGAPHRMAMSAESTTIGRSRLLLSQDGGVSWDFKDHAYELWASRVRYDASGRLHATMHTLSRNVLIRRELDGSWSEVGFEWPSDELGKVVDVHFGQEPGVLLLAGYRQSNSQHPRMPAIWRSGDDGLRWEAVLEGDSESVQIDHLVKLSYPRFTRFIALERSNRPLSPTGRIVLSNDDGRTWDEPAAGPPPFVHGALCQTEDNELYLIADVSQTTKLFSSSDGGVSWVTTGWSHPNSWQDGGPYTALQCGGEPGSIVVGNRLGEMLRSLDAGETFQPFNQGLGLVGDQVNALRTTEAGLYAATVNGLWFNPDVRSGPEKPRMLEATTLRSHMRSRVELAWIGGASSVDIWKDGARVATVENAGQFRTTLLNLGGSGTSAWTVCNAGRQSCSSTVTH
ncbi:YCF48-related protein [Alkalisalibacterium limincola]|uniref:YCF48-related protein n=1 Tax=Alkalisalibacterium limincola TaxID=2699169 RepID=UPI001C9C9B7D|nr:sialidase family protein [Alkalisalibacterium limincola]